MPRVQRLPPADRFFARLDGFECECPHCGKLIFSSLHRRKLPDRLQQKAHLRREAYNTPKTRAVWESVWNPLTQRLACPWCGRTFVAGLILYPVRPHAQRPLNQPPDTIPPPGYPAARRQAGGWRTKAFYDRGQDVNLAVLDGCSCGEDGRGWSSTCSVHGESGP